MDQDNSFAHYEKMRTPLSLIQMYSELMAQDAPPGSKFEDPLQVISRETLRLKGLVENLLTLGRMDRKALPLNLEAVDLRELARETIETLRPWANREGVVLDRDGESKDPAWVHADRGLAAQVIMNLLENALKYTAAHESRSRDRADITVRCVRLNGDVLVRDREGGGAVFVLRLPVHNTHSGH